MNYIKLIAFFSCFALSAQTINDLSFGTNDTFEIMTWNLETFPKNGQNTIDYATQIIEALDVDFIAIQEINNETAFNQLANGLVNYNGYVESTYYDGLALLYKPNVVEVNNIYRIYETSTYWNTFPRAPMVIDITYNNQQIFIINNHLKCCGDGTLILGDNGDEEYRRYDAMNLLKSYIDNNLPSDNVILLGDLNDVLTDNTSNNVFQNVLDDSSNYLFTDYDIAQGSSTNWSYPSWPSHLDHILITNELFDEFQLSSADVETIKIDDYLSGGFTEYNQNVTDHRPVALKLTLDSNLGVNDISENESFDFINYPNPCKTETVFSFKNILDNIDIEIYNTLGQTIFYTSVPSGQSTFHWKTDKTPNGIYFAKLVSHNKTISTRKVLVVK